MTELFILLICFVFFMLLFVLGYKNIKHILKYKKHKGKRKKHDNIFFLNKKIYKK